MARLPYMPLDVGALLSDTENLTNEEFGAYLRILCTTWRNNGEPFPDVDQELARVARVGISRWRAGLKPRLMRFFDISDGYWRQLRLENTWFATLKMSTSQRVKALQSWESRRAANALADNAQDDAAADAAAYAPAMPRKKEKYKKRTLNGNSGEGASNGVAAASPNPTRPDRRNSNAPHREPIISGYNPNNTRSPGESEWRNRLQHFRDSNGAFWPDNAGPNPYDSRCWLLTSPADIPHQHLLHEFGFR